MFIESPELSRIMLMTDDEVLVQIVKTLTLILALRHHICEEPEKEMLMMCFKSLHAKKRKPRLYESFRVNLVNKMNGVFKTEKDRDIFLFEFGNMWDEWCYAWKYL